ncbi:MAG TPA: FliI/YscN family ATPase [Pirellulales bacterium]|nr:FliI/YscN family ATPase [Pirellulales bacterium]
MFTLLETLRATTPTALEGTVVRLAGAALGVADFPAPMGAVVQVIGRDDAPRRGEVIGFDRNQAMVAALDPMDGVRAGDRVRLVRSKNWLRVGPELLGRIVNAHGQCIDGRPQPALIDRVPLERPGPSPTQRPPINRPLATGIRAIDGLLTCGRGQRLGIFAGSGVGKSVALGMMARRSEADVNVIALVGERGREVNEFIDRHLGPEGLARSVVVVATSDEPALVRRRAALVATAIAEYFRDTGREVLLAMDSLTRFALAQREIGLAAGEPATLRAFPPSVFAWLARLVERAGRTSAASITAMYSVLVDADDPNEPIADAVRGLLDGHVWLSRKLAARNHYPAIDILGSLSRSMPDVATADHRTAAGVIREVLATHRDHEELITLGVYRRGTDSRVDRAIEMLPAIEAYLKQTVDERSTMDDASRELAMLAARCDGG